jgi:hypothetical protein
MAAKDQTMWSTLRFVSTGLLIGILFVTPAHAGRKGAASTTKPAKPPMTAYLTDHEQFCRHLATTVRDIMKARDNLVPLTTVRAVYRQTAAEVLTGAWGAAYLETILLVADHIYTSPEAWGPAAPQQFELGCLSKEASTTTTEVWR